jgi:hypothetical protein
MINVVYLVIVFLSMILPMLFLSRKLKRKIIVAQNLTILRMGMSRIHIREENEKIQLIG